MTPLLCFMMIWMLNDLLCDTCDTMSCYHFDAKFINLTKTPTKKVYWHRSSNQFKRKNKFTVSKPLYIRFCCSSTIFPGCMQSWWCRWWAQWCQQTWSLGAHCILACHPSSSSTAPVWPHPKAITKCERSKVWGFMTPFTSQGGLSALPCVEFELTTPKVTNRAKTSTNTSLL